MKKSSKVILLIIALAIATFFVLRYFGIDLFRIHAAGLIDL